MQELTPEQRDIAEYLIGSLDDDGLLRKNMESIMDELAIYRGIYTTEEELNKILEIIQDFDPQVSVPAVYKNVFCYKYKEKPIHR